MITAAQSALRLLGILSDCVVDISFVSVALLSFKSRGWMNALFVEHLMPYAMLMRTTSTVIWWNIFKNGSLERWKRKSRKTSRTVQLSNVMKSKFVARTDGLVSGQDIILKMNLSENASFRDSHLHFKSVVFHFFTDYHDYETFWITLPLCIELVWDNVVFRYISQPCMKFFGLQLLMNSCSLFSEA